jgi:hypothetical protein
VGVMINTVILGKKYGLNYRLIEEEDAEFIVKLRTNEKLSRFLNQTSNDIFKQIEWMGSYKRREQEGIDFYYIFIDNSGNKLGLSRLYAGFNKQVQHLYNWQKLQRAF